MSATTFAAAAHSFAELVRAIPSDAWDGPGLGEWDLRSLVGHTSRSLTTVSTYLNGTAQRADITTPQEYYARVNPAALGMSAADVAERGRQAGRDLGADPAGAVDALVSRVLADLESADDPLIEVIGGLGIRLRTYLPTRTFELTVHGLDIARAAGLSFSPPPEALEEALLLAARIAAIAGRGEAVLLALTGRQPLPRAFSVV
ncbi:maleylpyruvate isomerase N-terminal domain-containing protein [Mycobacterium sp. IDR2000157661]|uniref:maleylpyruvate isomerase N-terminal domain-containing protein n=1 Tax=Mycobacterium sp. IDR2000157661 TaxID=2867005 RepID=UPI001EED42E8|nr:maleylpyruvate isomerase N-terminal domain-containing protein [Mycobacterium sp. IDR2000157661]ULE35363.1 maleylpyruvate isomerase N-terminal domain-containing protein [Mycobacterium sp. IDR2000157661]